MTQAFVNKVNDDDTVDVLMSPYHLKVVHVAPGCKVVKGMPVYLDSNGYAVPYNSRRVDFIGDDRIVATAYIPEPARESFIELSDGKHKCPYCKGITKDDKRGNCSACGGVRED